MRFSHADPNNLNGGIRAKHQIDRPAGWHTPGRRPSSKYPACVNHYHMWCNLRDGRKDIEFAAAVKTYLDYLKGQGKIEGWSLQRRKFGFGPRELGEFHVVVMARDLAQLDEAFSVVATRTGEVERLHAPVYAMAVDFSAALYRDFPDPQRASSPA